MLRKNRDGAMRRIAQFEKVSFAEFEKTYTDTFKETLATDQNIVETVYNEILLPRRATLGSAGYDFFSTCDISLKPGESVKVPTGIRARMEEGWVLMIYPRSGLGFRYRMQLANTVGVIDSDYYGSDNEGHIQIKITNDSRDGKVLQLKTGEAFAQGIFTEYGITLDDEAADTRNGGFGSTSV